MALSNAWRPNDGNQRVATLHEPLRGILSRVRCIALFGKPLPTPTDLEATREPPGEAKPRIARPPTHEQFPLARRAVEVIQMGMMIGKHPEIRD